MQYFGRSTHVRHVGTRRAAWTRLHAFQMNFFPRHDPISWDMGSLLKKKIIQTGLWSCEGTHPLASSSSSFGFRILYLFFFYLVCTMLYVGLSFLCFGLSASLFCVLIFFSLFFEPT